MAVLTNIGAARIAQSVMDSVQQFWIAWGTGDSAWDAQAEKPEPLETDTGLVAHLGHLKATAQYVVPDANGEIATASDERWTVSQTPTRYIFLRAPYDFQDEPGEMIRELAVYADATRDASVTDRSYLKPAQMSDLGELIQIERVDAKILSESNDGALKMVMKVVDADV